MPNSSYRKISTSPRHNRSNMVQRSSIGKMRSRSRSRNRYENDRSDKQNGRLSSGRRDIRFSSGDRHRDERRRKSPDREMKRDLSQRHSLLLSHAPQDPVFAHRHAGPDQRNHDKRKSLERGPPPGRSVCEQLRTRPRLMDEIDPWYQTKPVNDPSPAVTKGLHYMYDCKPRKSTLGSRFPGPVREARVNENITVDIQRKISGMPTDRIDRNYNPDMVIIPRSMSEGLEPLFDREDINAAMEATQSAVERRVVKMGSSRKKTHERSTGVTSYDMGHEGFKVELRMARAQSPSYIGSRHSNRQEQRTKEVGRSRDDLRFSLNTRRGCVQPNPIRNLPASERRAVRDRLGARPPHRPVPFERLSSRTRASVFLVKPIDRIVCQSESQMSPTRVRARSRVGAYIEKKEELPDFSRRPDKFKYHEWMDRPEMVPRASAYFDHDDRDGVILDDQINVAKRGPRGPGCSRSRGSGMRGRGFFGTRGGSWRRFKGSRERQRSPVGESSTRWEHDKFKCTDGTT